MPVNSVVIDEASQIEIGQYLPLFELFGKTLRKLSFIGDDKQRDLFSLFSPSQLSYPSLLFSTSSRERYPEGPAKRF